MKKWYITVPAKVVDTITIGEVIKIAVGALFGCAGFYLGYCVLWALMG